MTLIDTHAHIYDQSLLENLISVLNRAKEQGVTQWVVPAVDIPSGQVIIDRLTSIKNVYYALGVHPNEAHKCSDAQWNRLEDQIRGYRTEAVSKGPAASLEAQKLVALGETGLDLYWDDCPIDLQKDFLLRHLRLGKELNLPVIIHCRDAQDELGDLLASFVEQNGPVSGVIHSFSGGPSFLKSCIDWGFHIGFGGQITYKQKKFDSVREAAALAPEDRILVETDCPYLTPSPLRGKVEFNEPAYVAHTAQTLAAIRGIPFDALAEQTTRNARRLFQINDL